MAPTNPPIDPTTLKQPLDAATRNTIISWLSTFNAGSSFKLPGDTSVSGLQKLNDGDLIAKYLMATTLVGANQGKIDYPGSGTIDSVQGLISVLTAKNTWLRVGQFAIGGILIAVGFNAIFKSNDSDKTIGQLIGAKGVGSALGNTSSTIAGAGKHAAGVKTTTTTAGNGRGTRVSNTHYGSRAPSAHPSSNYPGGGSAGKLPVEKLAKTAVKVVK